MFSIATIYTAINLHQQSNSHINGREFPGVDGVVPPGPTGYQDLLYIKAITIVSTTMFLLNSWLADALLVSPVCNSVAQVSNLASHPALSLLHHLFHELLGHRPALPDVPCLSGSVHEFTRKFAATLPADVPDTAMGITFIYKSSQPGGATWLSTVEKRFAFPYYSISFALNILLTLMIIGRLFLLNKRIRKAMNAPVKISGLYKIIVTSLAESYALYSVVFLLFIGAWAAGDVLTNAFFAPLIQVQVIAPFLVTLRIANQSGSPNITIASGYTSSIRFRSQGKPTNGNGDVLNEDPISSTGTHREIRSGVGVGVETAEDLRHDD